MPDMTDRIALVTGAASGIGWPLPKCWPAKAPTSRCCRVPRTT